MSTQSRILERWQKNGHDSVRKFDAAKQSNITRSFGGSWGTADSEIRFDLRLIRARSRQLAENDKYMQGYINASLNNVLGPNGFNFQMKIRRSVAFGDNNHGELDTQANDIIESAYAIACNRKNYLVSRNSTKRMADRVKLRGLIVDGEIFVRTHTPFDNDSGIARQLIDPEVCDIDYNVPQMTNGNQVRMGVEIDEYHAPVAYWFLTRTPNDYQYPIPGTPYYRYRVEAKYINHIFIQTRPGQTRGVPWIMQAMLNLRMLGMFEYAALINAKIGASRNLFYTKTFPQGWTYADGNPYGSEDNGSIPDQLDEGEALELPVGVEPKMLDTRYPDSEIGPFSKCMLRGIAAGLGTSYMTLSNDLSEANFSSLRAGLSEERSQWAALQQFFIESDCQPDFESWLAWALAIQKVKLPPGKFDKFNKPEFTGRRWPSVNPLQDAMADVLQINNLLMSRSEVIRMRGRDPQEVYNEIEQDNKEAAEKGLHPIDDPQLQAEVIKQSLTETTETEKPDKKTEE